MSRIVFGRCVFTGSGITAGSEPAGHGEGGRCRRERGIGRRLAAARGLVAQEKGAEAHFLHGVAIRVRLALLVEHLVLRGTSSARDLAF